MLARWSPLHELLRNDDFFGPWLATAHAPTRRPAVDVVERDGAYFVEAELPGFAPEDIDVRVEGNLLTLKAERKLESDETEQGYRRLERRYGSFERLFTLPDSIDRDAIEASVDNGVLKVRLPKAKASLPRRVQVRVGELAEQAKQVFSGTKTDEKAA